MLVGGVNRSVRMFRSKHEDKGKENRQSDGMKEGPDCYSPNVKLTRVTQPMTS